MTDPRRTSRQSGAGLPDALEKLEETATQVAVPGEVDSWIRAVRDALDGLGPPWNRSNDSDEASYRQILKSDPELAPRVEEMREVSRELCRRLSAVEDELGEIRRKIERTPDTSGEEPVRRLEELRRKLLQWIVDCRAHRTELDTWFLEAVYRDRGVGD